MGGFPIPTGGGSATTPLETLRNVRNNVENEAEGIQNSAEALPGRLPTATDTDSAVTAQAHAAIASPSSLDDPGFQNRVARREVGNFDPEQGLRFNLAIDLIGNTSVADVTRGIQAPTDTPEAILYHPLLKNHDVTTSNQVEMGYQGENWSAGLRVDASVATRTEGVNDLAQDLQAVYAEGKKVTRQMQLIQRQLNRVQQHLNNSPEFNRLNQLATQASNNPTRLGTAELRELQTLMTSSNVQQVFQDLNGALSNSEKLMEAANQGLGIIGDQTRRLGAAAQVRGAAEVFVGYRSDAIDLGDDWQMQVGGEVDGIVPIPMGNVPVQEGLPALRTAMHSMATEVKVTTAGIGALQNQLQNLQGALNTVENSQGDIESAADHLEDASTATSTPQRVRSTLAAINASQRALNQLSTAGQQLTTEMGNLSETLDNIEVEVSGSLHSVEADPGVGLGLRDLSVRFAGPVHDQMNLEVLTGTQNALGYLSGTERQYDIDLKHIDQGVDFNLQSERQGNVFHDFYDPLLYQSFHLDGHFDNYRFDLQTRVEMSLNDPGKLRAGAILTQGIEALEVLTGISNSDVFGDHRPVQYQLGLSYADIGNVQVETDGFMQPDVLKASLGFQVQDQLQIQGSFVMSTTNVNGSTHADYAGVVSLGTPLFTGED